MLANTLSLTFDGENARVMKRINQDNYSSEYSYTDDTDEVVLKIRHDTFTLAGHSTKRHNVFVERTTFATPTESEKYWSAAITLRDRRGSGPDGGLELWLGFATLFATIDQDVVVGDN